MRLLAPLLALSASPAAADSYVGIMFRSVHVGDRRLNDSTLGLTLGRSFPLARPGLAWFVEGGVFRNSYRETSPLLMVGLRHEIGQLGPVRFALGAAVGTAYYPLLAPTLQRDYGIPNVNGYIPVVALSLTAQVGRVEWRLTTVPAGRDARAIFNLSAAVHF